jgi:fatty-acyl-CoA synthase
MNQGVDPGLARATSGLTIGVLLRQRARLCPERLAIVDGSRRFTYAAFNARVNRVSAVLRALGLRRGDRVAILSENRAEYLELMFAAGKLGVIVCTLNWRLIDRELLHCVTLTEPRATFVSPLHLETARRLGEPMGQLIPLGTEYEELLARASDAEPEIAAEAEDGHVIIYTSGTTGNPKSALVSHRAQIGRMYLNAVEFDLAPGDGFIAWAPMFHMVSTDHSIHVLCLGGTVTVIPAYDPERMLDAVEQSPTWWFVVMPGMIEDLIGAIKRRGTVPKGIKLIGAMADLVPRHQLAEITALLRAPYANTFGSTETGLAPASVGRIPIGEGPARLSKIPSACCEIRLVDPDDNDVADGTPGELVIRGPTLFSGYWNAHATNARDFRGGWFHLGDVFIRNPDETLDFVARLKYMIKSGGENVYPAEIEQVMLADPRVAEAVVVRQADARWGEVPVAFVARRDSTLDAEALMQACRTSLAGYKRPKEIRFIGIDDFPRSTTGKIQRHEMEKWLARQNRPEE